jgi:hypothetical protein
MLICKARAYTYHAEETRLEKLAKDKHANLSRTFVNSDPKIFYNIGPWLINGRASVLGGLQVVRTKEIEEPLDRQLEESDVDESALGSGRLVNRHQKVDVVVAQLSRTVPEKQKLCQFMEPRELAKRHSALVLIVVHRPFSLSC